MDVKTYRKQLLSELDSVVKPLGYFCWTNSNEYAVFYRRTDANKNCLQVAVYFSNKTPMTGLFTVGTALTHPTKGKTQLFRKDCSLDEVIAILSKPRIHTKKGYRKK